MEDRRGCPAITCGPQSKDRAAVVFAAEGRRLMAGRCSVCTREDRKAIDAALAFSSVRDIAGRFGLSKTAVHAHKSRHLTPAVARAIATRGDLSAAALVQRLADLLETCDEAMATAKKGEDLKALTSLIRESRELVVTIGRTVGLWTDKPATIIDQRRQVLNVAVGELSDAQLRAVVQRAAALDVEALPC